MEVRLIESDKKDFLPLLMLADEQEDMIDKYLERGDLFALFDDGLKSICVVTDEGDGNFELQNLATDERFWRQGYARHLVKYICEHYSGVCRILHVGTGADSETEDFYKKCGFTASHRIKNFFVDNYVNPIYENGVQIFDKIYMTKRL